MHGRSRPGRVWSILTFERLVTGPVIHLVYWAGLGVIIIAARRIRSAPRPSARHSHQRLCPAHIPAFRAGARRSSATYASAPYALLLAIPVLVGGLLAVGAAGLVWRAMCEFYVAIFRIGDDLAALRQAVENEGVEATRAHQTSGTNL
jgi:hypothetical protein